LLERRTVAARDERVARLPLDLIERVASGNGEEALHAKARALLHNRVHDLCGRLFHTRNLLDARHFPSCILGGNGPSGPPAGGAGPPTGCPHASPPVGRSGWGYAG